MQQAQVKLTETENSFIVTAGESESHFLKSNPLAHWLALRKVEEYQQRASAVADVVTFALGGRDSMLVPIEDLVRLSLCGGEVGSYVNGIIHARRSLQAAGVEA